jgi:hypothetical protein
VKPDAAAILREIARDIPYFAGMAALWGLILAAEIGLLVVASRRARRWSAPGGSAGAPVPDRRLEWLAIAGPLLYCGFVVLSVMTARGRLLRAFVEPDTARRVTIVNDNLGGLLNAPPFGVETACPLVVLAAAAVALNAWARRRARGETATRARFTQAAGAVVVLALVPLGYAVVSYCAALIKTAAGVAGVDPELRALMLTKGMEEARALLDLWTGVATGGLIACAVGIGASWLRAAGAGAGDEDRRARRLAGALLAAALALVAASFPLRAENRRPWPAPSRGAALNVGALETSSLTGPDPMPWAPVLFVEPGRLLVDGSPASPRRVFEMLSILRNNYTLLHPGEDFPGQLGVYCPARVPAASLARALQIAAAAGYERPSLIWTRPGVVDRPSLGAIPRPHVTAAAVALPSEESAGWLDVASAGTCGTLGERVLEWRRKGTYVQLKLPAGTPVEADAAD